MWRKFLSLGRISNQPPYPLKPKPHPEGGPDLLSFSEDVLGTGREGAWKVEPQGVAELLRSRGQT